MCLASVVYHFIYGYGVNERDVIFRRYSPLILPQTFSENATTPAVAAHPVALWLRHRQFHKCGCWREAGGGSAFRCGQLSIYTDNDILQGLGLNLFGVSALQCSWNYCSTLGGKGLRRYSQKRTLELFWLCLGNSCPWWLFRICKEGFSWHSSTQICIPSLFSLDLTQCLCQALGISLPLSQNVP